ncbi:epidermal retinol dehydrogenase 2-like [Lineus longissimus]|uniref:epidermal retinol dehydrogenase 2-like n=1 Tax=Lineus longissimus TaxID=88925 RepID=UPI00315C7FC0
MPNFQSFLIFFLEILEVIFEFNKKFFKAVYDTFVPARFRSKEVTGETVLITGAGSGLGRLLAVKFARLGASVIIWDINKDGNDETAQEIRKFGGRVFPYVCDLSSREQIYEVAAKVKDDVGEVNILVNNAGIVTGKKFLQCPDSLIQKTFDVNTTAHFWTSKAFLPDMLSRNHGHLVTIASAAGLFGVNGLADYCASKFGAVGFDESIREEIFNLGKDGVHTTVVCPSFINTGMFDGVKMRFDKLLPIMEPEYAASKIMEAILTNQHVLMMPRGVYLLLPLKALLPTRCSSILNKFCGISSSMDAFKGRNKKEE